MPEAIEPEAHYNQGFVIRCIKFALMRHHAKRKQVQNTQPVRNYVNSGQIFLRHYF